jgi:hypothetical protein
MHADHHAITGISPNAVHKRVISWEKLYYARKKALQKHKTSIPMCRKGQDRDHAFKMSRNT